MLDFYHFFLFRRLLTRLKFLRQQEHNLNLYLIKLFSNDVFYHNQVLLYLCILVTLQVFLMNNWLKANGIHLAIIGFFILICFVYFSPVLQGKGPQQSDVLQAKATAKEIMDYKE